MSKNQAKKLVELVKSLGTKTEHGGLVYVGKGDIFSLGKVFGLNVNELYIELNGSNSSHNCGDSILDDYFITAAKYEEVKKLAGDGELPAAEALAALECGKNVQTLEGESVTCIEPGREYRVKEDIKPFDIIDRSHESPRYLVLTAFGDNRHPFRIANMDGHILGRLEYSQEELNSRFRKVGSLDINAFKSK